MNNLSNSQAFDESLWRATCNTIATDAGTTCGCSHDLYVQKLSAAIDHAASKFSDQDQILAINVAREFDYATPAELAETQDFNASHGYCTHGIAFGCCPAGCDEPETFE